MYEKMYKLIKNHIEKNNTGLQGMASKDKKEIDEKVIVRVCEQVLSLKMNDTILESTQKYNHRTGKVITNDSKNSIVFNKLIDMYLTEKYYVHLREYFR